MTHITDTTLRNPYSTQSISNTLLEELTNALKHVSPYGSIEIYVQDNTVTQITVRNIKKTSNLGRENHMSKNGLADTDRTR